MTTDSIKTLFMMCLDKQPTDKALAREVKASPTLKEDLASFLRSSKFQEDDRIQFNWYIGVTFNMSINEINKTT